MLYWHDIVRVSPFLYKKSEQYLLIYFRWYFKMRDVDDHNKKN